MSDPNTKSTGEALQHLLEHVRRMDVRFFGIQAVNQMSKTSYSGADLTISNQGFSSATTQPSLRFVVNLEHYQPDNVEEYTVWVNDPKTDDLAANRAAVVAGIEGLISNKAWQRQPMITRAA